MMVESLKGEGFHIKESMVRPKNNRIPLIDIMHGLTSLELLFRMLTAHIGSKVNSSCIIQY